MKKILLVIVGMISSVVLFAQDITQYSNPILAGFYPDPSICKKGDDYYLVNSTFVYYPGLPIFHSKDLVNWKQIGNAINRPEQVNFDNAGVSRGLFAPAISYHNGLFYIVCTLVDKGGNFVITAKDPAGPWSNPAWLKELDGIDPSIFFDDNDKAYIVYNSAPPDDHPLYQGHRTIRFLEFDHKNLKVIGKEKLLVNGGTDITKKPVWIEAPHIFKKDGFYYLICAEGGTAYDHSEVVFRTKNLEDAFISYNKNPILTQRQLDPNRKDPITTTGHAEFIETKTGSWYAVFLGCRPYEGEHFNTGRETFMAPVKWKEGWPVITEGQEEIKYDYPVPMPELTRKIFSNFSGNYSFRDEFKNPQLDDRFIFLRIPKTNWYALSGKKNGLSMQLLPQTCAQKENPAFIGFRQAHLKCEATVSINFITHAENEKAGLLIFQNEDHYYYLCKSVQDNKPCIQLLQSSSDKKDKLISSSLLGSMVNTVQLKIEAKGTTYSFFYSNNNKDWSLLAENIDAKFLSTKTAGGFVGSVFALYATSNGIVSENKAGFNWFNYFGNDEALK